MKKSQASSMLPRRRTKRQHYDAAFKRHLVKLTLVPGASVARIAVDHRINANILFRWRRQYLRELGTRAPNSVAALSPVAVVSDAKQTSDRLSAGAPITPARTRRKHELGPSGVIIRAFCLATFELMQQEESVHTRCMRADGFKAYKTCYGTCNRISECSGCQRGRRVPA